MATRCVLTTLVLLFAMASGWLVGSARADEHVKQADFRDVPLSDALRLLSDQTGLNLTASAEASRVPVSLYLRNVPARAVVEQLCLTNNLSFREESATGILRVMTAQEAQRDLVSFREEKTEVLTLLYPNAVAIALAVRDLYGDRVQLTLGDEPDQDTSRDISERLNRFDLIDQRSQGLGFSSAGGVNVLGGGGASVFDRFAGSGYSPGSYSPRTFEPRRQAAPSAGAAQRPDERMEFGDLTPEQIQALRKAIEKPGAAAPETEALLRGMARRQPTIYVTVSRRSNLIVVRTGDPRVMEEIRALIQRLDVPTSLVLLEVRVLSVELGDGFRSLFDLQFTDGAKVAGGFSNGDIQPPGADAIRGAARRAAPLALGGSGLEPGALVFQYVSRNFRARLQVLEDLNRVTDLATPVLLTANNEVSRIFVGEERPIIRGISGQTIVGENVAATTPNTSIEFRPVGTTLLVTPNINSDRTVTLRLLQENSSVLPAAATIPVITSGGAVQQQPVDVVATRTVSGTVVAKDDLTVAVGGLIEEGVRDARSQVPVLGKIPGLGILFRRQRTEKVRREMIILIRPHILNTPAEAEDLSRKLAKELSVHPKAQDPQGGLDTYGPADALKPKKTK